MSFKIPSGSNKVQFSIRIDEEDFNIIEKLSVKSKKSNNYIINAMIKYAIDNMDLKGIKNVKITEK